MSACLHQKLEQEQNGRVGAGLRGNGERTEKELVLGGKSSLGDLLVDVFAGLEGLFPSDDLGDTFDEDVDELHFGFAKSVGVGDVPGAAGGGRVDSSGSSGLETHLGADGLEVRSSGEEWDFDHASSSETSSEVGWASQDPAEVLGVHEVGAFGLEDFLDLGGTLSESGDDRFDVIAFLHGDDSHLVLFIDPDEEVGGFVVEDSSGIGPVSAAAGGKEESRVGLLEKVSGFSEFLFFLFGHAVGLGSVGLGTVEREVVTLKVAFHGEETFDDESLEFSSLFEVGDWGELEAFDGSSGSASAGEHVLAGGVDLGVGEFGDIKVGGVDGVLGVATVSGGDDGFEKLGEELVALFISGDETDSLDHGVTFVVDAGLDAVAKGDTELGLLVLEALVKLGLLLKNVGQEVVVLGEVGELVGHFVGGSEEGSAFFFAIVLFVAASLLNPLGKFFDFLGESSWWVVRHF